MLTHRLAIEDDLPALRALMTAAIDQLQRGFISDDEITASHAVMGLDTQLIADRTYFVVAWDGQLAGCGGWSMRTTLFGGDHSRDLRNPARLDPAVDAARVRAMYTCPDFARRGVGRHLLDLSEAEAIAHGFRRTELMATLAGIPLYEACGYRPIEHVLVPTGTGVAVPMVRMGKRLDQATSPCDRAL